MPAEIRAHLIALLGINALRRGEEDNCIGCVGPSSCIYPIDHSALHAQQAGSREAVRWFTAYLDEWPGDLRVRWLLNIAAMTLGEYPDLVPPRFLVPIGTFRSKIDVGRFDNIALRAGLTSRGADLAGGCIFDDFTGDGRPDLFTTTFDVRHGASLYVNRGDGTFDDRSVAAGLSDQVYALNAVRADYDNDGWPDVLLLRGAWMRPARMSLFTGRGMQRGLNPNHEKRKLVVECFGALAEMYIAEELPAKRQGHQVARYIRADWLGQVPQQTKIWQGPRSVWKTEWRDGKDPIFRDRPAALITREDILTRLNTIRRSRGPYAARHALDAVRRVFGFATNHGHAGIQGVARR